MATLHDKSKRETVKNCTAQYTHIKRSSAAKGAAPTQTQAIGAKSEQTLTDVGAAFVSFAISCTVQIALNARNALLPVARLKKISHTLLNNHYFSTVH